MLIPKPAPTDWVIVYWSLRFHAQLFFTNIALDLHDVSQTKPDKIEANWTVRGSLRLPWETHIFFKGNSSYYLNERGLIYKHVDTWDRQPTDVLKQFLPEAIKNFTENL